MVRIAQPRAHHLAVRHRLVVDLEVIGRADVKWGEAVHAVVVVHDGAGVDEAALAAWCATRLAGYKRPKSYGFINETEMPRTATGKIQHRLLKTRLAAVEGHAPA